MGIIFCGTYLPHVKEEEVYFSLHHVTKWVEAKALYATIEKAVVEFIFEDIFTRFGKSNPYHPQENGQVESTNKVLEAILTKTIQLHHRNWADKLLEALWAYCITWRNVTGQTPYELVYGKHVLLSIEFQVKTFRTTTQLGMNLNEAQEQRLMQLNELDEIRQDAFHRTMLVQDQRDRWNDKFIKKNIFHPGDWALLYDNMFNHFKGKFSTRWLGPYEVDEVFENGSMRIKNIDGS
eukprot:PITA_34892